MEDNGCKCFLVVRWEVVQGSDETMPIYSPCPVHPEASRFDTQGYYDRPLSELFGEVKQCKP